MQTVVENCYLVCRMLNLGWNFEAQSCSTQVTRNGSQVYIQPCHRHMECVIFLESSVLKCFPRTNYVWLTVKGLSMRVLRLCGYWFEDEKLSTRSRVGPKQT